MNIPLSSFGLSILMFWSASSLALNPTVPLDIANEALKTPARMKLVTTPLKSIKLLDLSFASKADNITLLLEKAVETGKLKLSDAFRYKQDLNALDKGDELLLKCLQTDTCNVGTQLTKANKSLKTVAVVRSSEQAAQKISYSELPLEAQQTLKNIEKGGPFPHAKDGTTFHNREEKLPVKEPDYYSEYTVETPGASNRGAKRIIVGKNGEKYYTDDHYETFMEIIE